MTPPPDPSRTAGEGTDAHLVFARRMDRIDGLAHYRRQFVGTEAGTAAGAAADPFVYLDGNSLGRPTLASVGRITEFLTHNWGTRLIRGWDEEWMELPFRIGDELGRVALGAAPGQVFIGDSTTVLLYKLARAAVDYRRVGSEPARTEIVLDTDNFPTDRYLIEGIAAERGLTLHWIHSDPAGGVSLDQVRAAIGQQTALVLLSHVAYRSGFLADMRRITAAAHSVGALVLWDLSHSVGSVPVELDLCDVDLAVGCSYKYLNGGPGAPAFGYVRRDLQDVLTQPIQGWMGTKDVFTMGPGYHPADGIRRFQSGTPPVVGMLAMQDTIAMIGEAGIEEVRAKSVALTEFAITLVDEWLVPLGVRLTSPRDHTHRGGHVTVNHPAMRQVTTTLWEHDVIPDFRGPEGLRIGLSPLSTSFVETLEGVAAIRDVLRGVLLGQAGLAPGTGIAAGFGQSGPGNGR
ncbi:MULTISPECIES: kynureninase [unclassified Cryobacterium]|uniref:kynureninase n=2 Tax=unclassified Cryobacterium TaxID=2649013 RepID=UPI00106B7F97|nr:aminotransferase class V-fold PLP-dependent enzyme [Cryobacterium sp. MDB2-A-1]TFC09037.1 aminotransferase class V-fold PLP-dependent enzyme [Cryobacterium sp. MDB2-33-2]TFC14817.1 aminotransferase class V-fold PLP-dependent enzyme [Cryobacterium sp. MDB2-A-2]TFC16584.1 aminotransferase class V-fold PLP-dependent enzyme [Cryobacterium sp. MDB2-10]TFC35573.1 aminotransferase class V-fold PLP-dependent enzyme [Cryobacterium sp. MDB1-18-2]TFC46530.1 aminotransferase class V-fold PLP-dependent 